MLHGDLQPAFWPVARALERQLRRKGGGAAVCVYWRGRPVVDLWGGVRDGEDQPWQRDTPAMCFSTTKGVAATALHVLVDRGLLDYDDPVAKHWPEFACNGKDRITIRQVLCHEAGLHHIRRLIDHGERILDWSYMVHALEQAHPDFEPGSMTAYHGLTYGWLVGEVVQRVARRPFAEVIQTEIAKPLGLDGCWIGAPPEARRRAAVLRRPPARSRNPERFRVLAKAVQRLNRTLGIPFDPAFVADSLLPRRGLDAFWNPSILEVPIPAANGLFTARSLARLYAALAGGGTLDGVRLLSPQTLERATEVQNRAFDKVIPVRMNWRLGYHRVFTSAGDVSRGFGHFGFGGSGAWADPQRNLAVAMINNVTGGGPFGDYRMMRIGGAAARCVDGSERRRTAKRS